MGAALRSPHKRVLAPQGVNTRPQLSAHAARPRVVGSALSTGTSPHPQPHLSTREPGVTPQNSIPLSRAPR